MNRVQTVTQKHYRVKNPVQNPNWLHEPLTGPASAPGVPRRAHACRVVASPAPCHGQGPVVSWPRPGRIVAEAPGRIAMLRAVSQTQCRSSLRAVLPPAAYPAHPRAPSARTPVPLTCAPALCRAAPHARAPTAPHARPAQRPCAYLRAQPMLYRGLAGHCIAIQSNLALAPQSQYKILYCNTNCPLALPSLSQYNCYVAIQFFSILSYCLQYNFNIAIQNFLSHNTKWAVAHQNFCT